jgi:hypothetical protein
MALSDCRGFYIGILPDNLSVWNDYSRYGHFGLVTEPLSSLVSVAGYRHSKGALAGPSAWMVGSSGS